MTVSPPASSVDLREFRGAKCISGQALPCHRTPHLHGRRVQVAVHVAPWRGLDKGAEARYKRAEPIRVAVGIDAIAAEKGRTQSETWGGSSQDCVRAQPGPAPTQRRPRPVTQGSTSLQALGDASARAAGFCRGYGVMQSSPRGYRSLANRLTLCWSDMVAGGEGGMAG